METFRIFCESTAASCQVKLKLGFSAYSPSVLRISERRSSLKRKIYFSSPLVRAAAFMSFYEFVIRCAYYIK